MNNTIKFLAMSIIAMSFAVTAQAQYANPTRAYVKAIDSVQLAGISFNAIGISITNVTDSVATVQSNLRYVGNIRTTLNHGQLSFTDTLHVYPSTGMNVVEAARRVAFKHDLRLK